MLFCRICIFWKIGKHHLCSEGKKTHFRCNYLLLENGPFLCPFKVTKHNKNRGFSRHKGKTPKWHFWLQKCHFGKGPWKQLYYLWYLKAVFCCKHYFYSVSAKHSFAEIKECKLKQRKFTKNRGGVCQHAKRCFFFVCCVFSLCFLFGKEPQKVIFLQF